LGADDLVCPYSTCGRTFIQPVLVTDGSRLPRQTFYACPHCMLRLELSFDNNHDGGHVHVRAVEEQEMLEKLNGADGFRQAQSLGEGVSSMTASRPSKSCRHFLGFLRESPDLKTIPDDCAVCPLIVQCYVSRE
jgi:hypothetical protein